MRLLKPSLSGLVLLLAQLPVFAADEMPSYWLTVLHNNDGESALLPRTVEDGSATAQFGGVAYFAALVAQQKAAVRADKRPHGVIMLSSGDNFLAGPILNASLDKGPPYYDALAMSAIGYDAVCIGNHDFDFGPSGLADFIAGFPPEVRFLSANLEVSREPRLAALATVERMVPSTVVSKAGEKIGIVGATTSQLPYISSPRRVGVDPVAPAVQREIDRLLTSGVNKIILISHLQSITDDMELIPQLRGVDIAIAGGGDELLANEDDELIPGDRKQVFGRYPILVDDADARRVPVITTSGSYRYLGRLQVGFDAAGEIVQIDAESGPLRVAAAGVADAITPHEPVLGTVAEPVRIAVQGLAAEVIGHSEVPLDGRRIQVRTRSTNQGELIADALLWQAQQLATEFDAPLPQVALQNGGGIRNDSILPVGELSALTAFEMVPFPNFVTIVPNVSRKQFKEILENAVSLVEDGAGRFAQIAGFSMVLNLKASARVVDEQGQVQTPGERVREVTLADGSKIIADGTVQPGPDLTVATVDFLARGGDQYPFGELPLVSLGITYQQAVQHYIVGALGGQIRAERYPEGGDGRIQSTE